MGMSRVESGLANRRAVTRGASATLTGRHEWGRPQRGSTSKRGRGASTPSATTGSVSRSRSKMAGRTRGMTGGLRPGCGGSTSVASCSVPPTVPSWPSVAQSIGPLNEDGLGLLISPRKIYRGPHHRATIHECAARHGAGGAWAQHAPGSGVAPERCPAATRPCRPQRPVGPSACRQEMPSRMLGANDTRALRRAGGRESAHALLRGH
jgi:hypothetical protein